jgi:hypothetical protein
MNSTTTQIVTDPNAVSDCDLRHLSVFAAKHVCKAGWSPEQARHVVPMDEAAFAELSIWYRRMEVTGEFGD